MCWIYEIENNNTIKILGTGVGGIIDFKMSYQPGTNIAKDEKVICLQTPTEFWLGEGTISPSSWMYMRLIMLGRQEYTQQNH
jgi:hypothetical protein